MKIEQIAVSRRHLVSPISTYHFGASFVSVQAVRTTGIPGYEVERWLQCDDLTPYLFSTLPANR